MTIRKRDKTLQKFDEKKITSAIRRAFKSVHVRYSAKATKDVCNIIYSKGVDEISVEEIQDIIENYLLNTPEYVNVGRSFAIYREDRRRQREDSDEVKEKWAIEGENLLSK